ncbi:MAG: phosphoribosylglycinamide formyltransferase [Candidatus Aminicenantes bacterium RBG_19FT_COMBO_65_30]|nr:MAG: phosphoribosylglycinamide formyltransferase [Candidatus Aminicenantes bacterium RBG_19FT_COMBO_65_30]
MDDIVFRSPRKRGRVAVFLSGRGSNFMAIREAVRRGDIDADIRLVLSNKADAPGLVKAREGGLETLFLDPKLFTTREEYDRAIIEEVERRRIDLICLAGYMKVLTPGLCDAFKHRIVNIHPALLPSFPGLHVQQKAIDWGVRFSGCTVHFVAAEVDMGPIILQAVVPVLQDDTEETLAARILVEEHKIYPEAVRLYFGGRIEVRGRRVFILETGA